QYVHHGRAFSRLPRTSQFALAASSLALQDASIKEGDLDPERCGIYVGTSAGTLADTFAVHKKWLSGDFNLPPHLPFHLFNHSSACFLSSHFDLRGQIQTVTSGCNSGLDALGLAIPLIQLQKFDAMLVVGTDCLVTPEFLALMNANNTLTTRFNHD